MNVFDVLNDKLLAIERRQLEIIANLRKKKKAMKKTQRSGGKNGPQREYTGPSPWVGPYLDFTFKEDLE